jgi:methylenetetrahydrofolate dehydrogenase (NADP+)/methenyltetrahydrofolate cyclohydrolase
MKLLSGLDLASYIKERQLHQSRSLRQSSGVTPRLAIVRTNPSAVVNSYMKMKQAYGEDIAVEVIVHDVDQKDALATIKMLNDDPETHGIIVQIPLPDISQTDEILNAVDIHKDVDGLAANTTFDAATPMAINWLIAGYNIDLRGKNIVIVGNGRLVGKPLAALWKASELPVTVIDRSVPNIAEVTKEADVLVCATGVPALITADMIKPDAIIVDAGVATDSNGLVGDIAASVRELPNITITPEKGGVGPLTICALFDNVLRAALASAKNQ